MWSICVQAFLPVVQLQRNGEFSRNLARGKFLKAYVPQIPKILYGTVL